MVSNLRYSSTSAWFGEKVWWEEGSTAKEHVRRLLLIHLHYRLFSLSLYLAVLHPGINHLFPPSYPTCQASLISTSGITTTMEKTQRSLYKQLRNKLKWNTHLGNPSFYSYLLFIFTLYLAGKYLPGKYMVNHSIVLRNYHW